MAKFTNSEIIGAAEIAAAEQRGAIKALRDAAEDYGHKELDDRADLLEGNE